MRTKRQEGVVWPLLAGTSLAARIRRLTFAVFGLAAAAGLALVAFVAQTGYPVLSVAPLPLPGPALTAPGTGVTIGEADGGSFGLGFSLPADPGFADGPGALSAASGEPPELALTGVGAAGPGQSGSTQSGLAGPNGESGLDGAPQPEVTAVTPAQEPTAPADPALASVPVDGSSSSSALFVRSSVAPGIGGEGDLGSSAPVEPGEPEIPYEPEVPVEPDVPVEPEAPVEPEVPVEPPVEEAPVEEPPAEEPPATEPAPSAETAPEAPVG